MRIRSNGLGMVDGVAGTVHWRAIGQVAHIINEDGTRQRRSLDLCMQGAFHSKLPGVCGSGPMFSGWLMQLPAMFIGVPSGR